MPASADGPRHAASTARTRPLPAARIVIDGSGAAALSRVAGPRAGSIAYTGRTASTKISPQRRSRCRDGDARFVAQTRNHLTWLGYILSIKRKSMYLSELRAALNASAFAL